MRPSCEKTSAAEPSAVAPSRFRAALPGGTKRHDKEQPRRRSSGPIERGLAVRSPGCEIIGRRSRALLLSSLLAPLDRCACSGPVRILPMKISRSLYVLCIHTHTINVLHLTNYHERNVRTFQSRALFPGARVCSPYAPLASPARPLHILRVFECFEPS